MRVNKKQMKNALSGYIDRNYFENAVEHTFSAENKVKINVMLAENSKKSKKVRAKMKKFRIGRIIAVVCLCIILMSVVAYAASPDVRNFINMRFLKTDSVQRITEVSEGYIGIYTAKDLDNVRNNLLGNYILMNDIFLTEEDYEEGGIFEGGFVPIGALYTDGESFEGIFNGNGYVISGLVINGNYNYAGLFGKVKRNYDFMLEENTDENNTTFFGPTDRTISGGIIKNLGITDSVIKITKKTDNYNDAYVGVIAGYADYVIGCYTENVDVIVENLNKPNNEIGGKTAIGGIVGRAYFVDSCYSDAHISLLNADDDIDDIYVSGIAGYSFSCVTSYFNGEIDSGDYSDYGVTFQQEYDVPIVLNEEIMDEIVSRLNEAAILDPVIDDNEKERIKNRENSFNSNKFMAFYCSSEFISLDISSQEFYTAEATDKIIYLLDPDTKEREYRELARLIAIAFPNNDFNEFCRENNLKSGYYYCYDLRDEPECTFEGFDFTSIWDFTDTTPQLKLFTGGTFKKTPQQQYSDGNLYRLEWQKKVLKNLKNS